MTCPYCGRPKLLDTYSGEGGAGAGYARTGFCCDPVDNSPARLARYPRSCPNQIYRIADAVETIVNVGRQYAAHHASPPCTGYTQATSMIVGRVVKYDRLIGATRAALETTGRPYVIENVTSAAARAELRDPLMLCWTEFRTPGDTHDTDGTPLWMRRHRLFETSFPVMSAGGCAHPRGMQCAGAYGGARRDKHEARNIRHGGYTPAADVMARLLGIDWMTETGLKLSIPPAYTEHIGAALLEAIK